MKLGRFKYFFYLSVPAILFSCKKDTIIIPQPPDIKPILLKEILVESLPSPYYHFEYDVTGKVTFVSFASDFFRYNVFYNGDKISEMRNDIIVNKDRIQYNYDNAGRVNKVTYADSTGIIKTRLSLSYAGQRLIRLEREHKTNGGFTVDKVATFSYYPDENLQELVFHYLSFINGQPVTTQVYQFEQYDNKVNVDGFGLIKNEFFDHVVLLPSVRLQKNNPGKVTITVNGHPFLKTNDTYSYNDKNLPLIKTSELNILSGADSGRVFVGHTDYSYY